MKIDRLIGIITILLQQERATAPELARRFEVSRRTINRDVEDIIKAGIPLVTTQGHGGGISIMANFKLDKALLTGDELQAILAGVAGIDSVSCADHLMSLTEKLYARGNAPFDPTLMTVDLSSPDAKPLTQKIDAIKGAILDGKIIAFQYYSEKGANFRRIEPYRLVFRWGGWYVLGYCLKKNGWRLFKLNRLWSLSVLGEGFAPRSIPANALDFDDYFLSNQIRLRALFHPSVKHRLIEEYGVDCFTPWDGGELLFEWDFVSYENMRQWVFSFGDKVRILAPQMLDEDRQRQAQNIIAM